MRAYLPLSHDELAAFLNNGSKELESILAPTPFYVGENEDLDEEEIEYLLSLEAAQASMEMRPSNKAPGIVLAIIGALTFVISVATTSLYLWYFISKIIT